MIPIKISITICDFGRSYITTLMIFARVFFEQGVGPVVTVILPRWYRRTTPNVRSVSLRHLSVVG